MADSNIFDVIIIGGSYAGLSAGMALGRSLRKVLIIDSGRPCNRQTPHSHNFITQDGKKPQDISAVARQQVEKYDTVNFHEGLATKGTKTENSFEIETEAGETFKAKKLIFATGLRDIMPEINGFSECWGISVIHCPYCHGYESKQKKTGILANGDAAFHYAQLVSNLTDDLTIFTNGKAIFIKEQRRKLEENDIEIIEAEIDGFEQNQGQIEHIIFKDGSTVSIDALYAGPPFEQHSEIPENLGCELTEHGYLEIDDFHHTTIPGVFACGDNTSFVRSVANAVAAGNFAGAAANHELCEEEF